MLIKIAAASFLLFVQCTFVGSIPAASPVHPASSEEDMYRIEAVVEDESAPVDWRLVSDAIRRVSSGADLRINSSKDVRELMAGILRRRTPLNPVPNSPVPSIQPPLEMLKAAAIEALVRMGAAREYEFEIQTVYDETKFVVLKGKAEKALMGIREPVYETQGHPPLK